MQVHFVFQDRPPEFILWNFILIARACVRMSNLIWSLRFDDGDVNDNATD